MTCPGCGDDNPADTHRCHDPADRLRARQASADAAAERRRMTARQALAAARAEVRKNTATEEAP